MTVPFLLHSVSYRHLLRPVVVAACVFAANLCPADETAESGDSTTMVIMAPVGPVFADMRILVDGQSYRLWVSRFLGRKLDVNSDRSLSLTELQLIPQRLLQQIELQSAKQVLRQAAGSKEAGSVSSEQFNAWFSERLSRSFNIIAGAVRASEAVRLATLIDRDGDGGVSETELQQGSRTLRFRDLDDDQTFTASELMPYRDPRNQQAAVIPDVANLPFVQLTDEASLTRTTEQLLKRYGDGKSIPVTAFRLPNDGTVSPDTSGDGRLDTVECRKFLETPAHHLTLEVRLSDRTNASELAFRVHDSASQFCRSVSERRGRASLAIDDMPISVRARGGSTGARSFFTSFLLQRMSLYDKDRNNYLSEEEFPQMQQQMVQQQITGEFEDVDLNSDGMLFREELLGYIERDAISTQSRIEVSVKQDGKTLFSLLDRNTDRRLTTRELRDGFDVLLKYDVNEDRKLMERELGTAYILEIGLAQAEALRVDSMRSMNMMNQSTDAVLPGISGLKGPEWFRRMDRNQDRDVSWREFLGPKEVFEELDKDTDGLISALEAEKLAADD